MKKRILYGVTGEGLGHAFRSKVVLNDLVKHYRVKIISWERSYQLLSRLFEDVEEITGLHIIYQGNYVNYWETVRRNVGAFIEGGRGNLRTLRRIRDHFKPDVVISDFEPSSNLLAHRAHLPVGCIDNIHVLSRCAVEVPPGCEIDFGIARLVTAAMTPGADHYFITSFFEVRPTKSKTTIVPPILREEVLKAKPTSGDHIVVYHTVPQFRELVDVLERAGSRYLVYGFNTDEEIGRVSLRRVSETAFLRDLASAKAVITGGGFTLITEALQLGKPIYSIPVLGQFEQVLNAHYLQRMGFGEFHRKLDPESLLEFEKKIPLYAENLRAYPRSDNSEMLAEVHKFLDSVT